MTEHLFRDTARENYFYQLGRVEILREFTDAGLSYAAGVGDRLRAQEAVVRNARSQVDE